MNTREQSPSGSPIYRHEASDRPFTPASGDEVSLDLISQHVETYIGPIASVFHEIVSDLVHVDILFVAPTPARNFITLVTCGMSNLPMTVPSGAEAFRYAELMICLPPDWKLSNESFEKEENYWPIRTLKTLARLPHEYNSWLYAAHTIPNKNPAEPYAPNTKLMGAMLAIPSTVEPINEFFTLTISPEKDVHFFSLLPLYSEEMDYKLKHGAEALFEKLDKARVTELLDPHRKNTCKKLFGLF
ncbi:suppressor of fused domain protein [Paenibacillus roseipurpureus]|uniref:Suppressor of fused domain protein n=1 Tax=Paenibacillus roseopurpureus TaxID=2918901 RepID=A0AA96LM91_9BACL|nr:suppressor of fused domain protein [Paenibacillus sp. MBLB1832]WNR44355.1 suppressor of fused domain protein [Paenibacillus sp. MBLB1832]